MNKLFGSKLEILKLVKSHYPELDLNASCKGGFYVAIENGKAYYDPNLRYWLERLNKVCGMKFNQHMSRKLGRQIMLYAQDGVEDGYLDIKVTPVAIVPDKVETPPVVVKKVEEVKPISELDMDFAKEFQYKDDKKAAKKALDAYAHKFGVELNGRKSIGNMLKDLQEAVNA